MARGMRRWPIFWLMGLLALPWAAKAQEEVQEPAVGAPTYEVLVIDLSAVVSQATAYTSIQEETERGRDFVNQTYEDLLRNLQSEGDALRARELDMTQEEFLAQSADLEARALALEQKRQENIQILERRRREAIVLVDRELASVLSTVVEEMGALYILSKQVVVIWPEGADVTARVIAMLDERLPSVNFKLNLTIVDGEVAPSDAEN